MDVSSIREAVKARERNLGERRRGPVAQTPSRRSESASLASWCAWALRGPESKTGHFLSARGGVVDGNGIPPPAEPASGYTTSAVA